MISSRKDACGILGISISASEAEIKTAYRALMKLYHPDEAGLDTMESFREVKEAYDYLISGAGALPSGVRMATASDFAAKGNVIKGAPSRGATVSGTARTSASDRYASNVSSAADYERFQKRYKQSQVEKKAAFAKKEADYSAKVKKQDDDFKRAMEAIEMIRAAWALEAWIAADKK